MGPMDRGQKQRQKALWSDPWPRHSIGVDATGQGTPGHARGEPEHVPAVPARMRTMPDIQGLIGSLRPGDLAVLQERGPGQLLDRDMPGTAGTCL
jgi:hypothetical protein